MIKSTSLLCAIVFIAMIAGCSSDSGVMRNGYYSAVADSFNADGWKEFITIYVYNNRIVTVEYNARNASGLVLSWDVLSMRRLKAKMNVHPNQILREYAQELLNRQNPENIKRVRGDTCFYDTFKKLAVVAVAQARTGDKRVAEVPLTEAVAITE